MLTCHRCPRLRREIVALRETLRETERRLQEYIDDRPFPEDETPSQEDSP